VFGLGFVGVARSLRGLQPPVGGLVALVEDSSIRLGSSRTGTERRCTVQEPTAARRPSRCRRVAGLRQPAQGQAPLYLASCKGLSWRARPRPRCLRHNHPF